MKAYGRTTGNRAVHDNPDLAALQLALNLTPMEAEIAWALYTKGPLTCVQLTDETTSLSVGLKDRQESVRTVIRNLRKKLRVQNLPARYKLGPEVLEKIARHEMEKHPDDSIDEAMLELRSLYSV